MMNRTQVCCTPQLPATDPTVPAGHVWLSIRERVGSRVLHGLQPHLAVCWVAAVAGQLSGVQCDQPPPGGHLYSKVSTKTMRSMLLRTWRSNFFFVAHHRPNFLRRVCRLAERISRPLRAKTLCRRHQVCSADSIPRKVLHL